MSLNRYVVWREYTENVYFYFDLDHPDLKGKFAHLYKLIINEQGLERVKNLLDWVIEPEVWRTLKKRYNIKGPPMFNIVYGFRLSFLEDMDTYYAKRESTTEPNKPDKKNLLLRR